MAFPCVMLLPSGKGRSGHQVHRRPWHNPMFHGGAPQFDSCDPVWGPYGRRPCCKTDRTKSTTRQCKRNIRPVNVIGGNYLSSPFLGGFESALREILDSAWFSEAVGLQKPTEAKPTPTHETKHWSEVIELPTGFNLHNLEDIDVSGDKVVIKLAKVSRDRLGTHSIKAVRSVQLPVDVDKSTLKCVLLQSNKVKIVAVQQIRDNQTKAESADPDKNSTGERKETDEQAQEAAVKREDAKQDSDEDMTPVANNEDAVSEAFVMVDNEGLLNGNQDDCNCQTCENSCADTEMASTHDVPVVETVDSDSDDDDQDDSASLFNEKFPLISPVGNPSDSIPGEVHMSDKGNDKAADEEKNIAESDGSWPRVKEARKEAEENRQDNTDNVELAELASRPEFRQTLTVEPFNVEDFTLKLSGKQLFIDAVHKDEDEGNTTSFEMHKSITIPDEVDLDQLKSRETEDGKLLIIAPYLSKKEPTERILKIEL